MCIRDRHRITYIARCNSKGEGEVAAQYLREQGIEPEFAERQLRLVAAYERMGIAPTCTCTPYLIGNLPGPGEHVAWAESSAVAFASTSATFSGP